MLIQFFDNDGEAIGTCEYPGRLLVGLHQVGAELVLILEREELKPPPKSRGRPAKWGVPEETLKVNGADGNRWRQ